MYNCNTDSLGLILGVEVFFSEGHCSGALCWAFFYFFSSFSWTLPWSSCDNSWNSAQCRDDHLDTGPDTANMSAVEAPSNHTSYSSPSDEFFQ